MANELIKRAYSESEYTPEYTPEFLKRLNESKYVRIYFNLIEKAFRRSHSSGMERHHFIPKCMGGIKTVSLTYREHFIAHLLLTRMMTDWEDRRKMYFAFNMMLKDKYGQRHAANSRWYEYAKNKLSVAMSERDVSAETRRKIGDIHRGKTLSEETKKKISEANTGRSIIISNEHAKKISNALKNKPKSDEHRQKLSLAKIGKVGTPRTEEWKIKIGEANKARWAARKRENVK